VKERWLNVFADANLDYSIKLGLMRDLERLYSFLLTEPIPPQLRSFVERLGEALDQRSDRQH
jgi:hypothetical protein